MEIQLLAFGQIIDIVGKSVWKMQGIEDSNSLIEKLEEQYPVLSTTSYSIAVNKKIIQENTVLKENDTIALLPPFSGG